MLASVLLFLERFVLSPVFLYEAWTEIAPIRAEVEALEAAGGGHPYTSPGVVAHLLMLVFNLQVGGLLLLSRKPSAAPRSAKDVLVPLLATFFNLSSNLFPLAPEVLARNRLPEAWQATSSAAALYLGLAGLGLAIWSTASLGRSFGVLVAVRPVVTSGPYRHVRHPIYLSYVLQMGGWIAANGSLVVMAYVAIFLALVVWRARLEEARIAEHSAEYRAYAERTPFLFPRMIPGRRASATDG
jgi:protein-S-isoprenylcysteine O-methyltransferase Ste14